MQSLKSGSEPVLTSSNRWSKFAEAPKDSQGSEDGVSSPLPEIFTKVVVAIVANSGGNLKEDNRTVDFLQNTSQTPTSAETHDETHESRPDGYLVLKDAKKEDRLYSGLTLRFHASTSGKTEVVIWTMYVFIMGFDVAC